MALAEALHHSAGPSKKKVVERRERPSGGGGPAAGDGSHGRLRGCQGSSPRGVVATYLLRAELKKKKEEEEEERKQVLADEALDEKLDAEMDVLMAIGSERLTSRQHARLSAVLRERAELVERRKKRRTMRKRKKRSKRKLPKSSSGVRVRRCGQGSVLARRRLVVVDVSVNMYDMFQQLPIYSGRCLLPFLRQSGGHSSYATETGAVVYRCSCFPARYCATTGPLGPHSADICAGSAFAVHRWSSTSLFLRSCCYLWSCLFRKP